MAENSRGPSTFHRLNCGGLSGAASAESGVIGRNWRGSCSCDEAWMADVDSESINWAYNSRFVYMSTTIWLLYAGEFGVGLKLARPVAGESLA